MKRKLFWISIVSFCLLFVGLFVLTACGTDGKTAHTEHRWESEDRYSYNEKSHWKTEFCIDCKEVREPQLEDHKFTDRIWGDATLNLDDSGYFSYMPGMTIQECEVCGYHAAESGIASSAKEYFGEEVGESKFSEAMHAAREKVLAANVITTGSDSLYYYDQGCWYSDEGTGLSQAFIIQFKQQTLDALPESTEGFKLYSVNEAITNDLYYVLFPDFSLMEMPDDEDERNALFQRPICVLDSEYNVLNVYSSKVHYDFVEEFDEDLAANIRNCRALFDKSRYNSFVSGVLSSFTNVYARYYPYYEMPYSGSKFELSKTFYQYSENVTALSTWTEEEGYKIEYRIVADGKVYWLEEDGEAIERDEPELTEKIRSYEEITEFLHKYYPEFVFNYAESKMFGGYYVLSYESDDYIYELRAEGFNSQTKSLSLDRMNKSRSSTDEVLHFAYSYTTNESERQSSAEKAEELYLRVHKHTISEKYSYDANGHWFEYTCGHHDLEEKEAHEFGEWVVDQDVAVSYSPEVGIIAGVTQGHRYRECVCGYKEEETLTANKRECDFDEIKAMVAAGGLEKSAVNYVLDRHLDPSAAMPYSTLVEDEYGTETDGFASVLAGVYVDDDFATNVMSAYTTMVFAVYEFDGEILYAEFQLTAEREEEGVMYDVGYRYTMYVADGNIYVNRNGVKRDQTENVNRTKERLHMYTISHRD